MSRNICQYKYHTSGLKNVRFCRLGDELSKGCDLNLTGPSGYIETEHLSLVDD
jgi:hypothetical protein